MSAGIALRRQARYPEALQAFNAAMRMCPNDAEIRANRALVLLQLGEYTAGWREYEYRLQDQPALVPQLPIVYWQGEQLHGKRILLIGEQGLGDQIQFLRFATLLADQGAHVEIALNSELLRLARTVQGVKNATSTLSVPANYFDYYCSLMSLPSRIGLQIHNIPIDRPYVMVDPVTRNHWQQKVNAVSGEISDEIGKKKLRIGLVWAGGSLLDAEARRSLNLEMMSSLLDLANTHNCSFFSLQIGRGAAQLAPLQQKNTSLVLHDLTQEITDFYDTAALMGALDLVIACDTAVAHLAGALHIPVWILNRKDQCWRWLLDRNDSPWYPSARLFRQSQAGDWDTVIEAVKSALTLRVPIAP